MADGGGGFRLDQAVVRTDGFMRGKLAFGTAHGGERGDGGHFAFLPIQRAVRENVAEQVSFEIAVDVGREVEQRAFHFSADEFGLRLRAVFQAAKIFGNRCRRVKPQ
nr:hypothetical protein [Neisseria chenwenguii]